MVRLIKTTVIGGIVFLVPIVIAIAVVGKGLEFTGKIAAPLASVLPMGVFGEVAIVHHLLALLILIVICFLAGLAAKTALAGRFVESLETSFLSKVPAYALMKTKTQTMLTPEDTEGMTPVLARFDDSWQVALEIERVEGDKVVLFLPGSPDPWSGSVCVLDAERVTPMGDATVGLAASISKRLGKGSGELLRASLRASAQTS
jgi:uncharacterized membrane protein